MNDALTTEHYFSQPSDLESEATRKYFLTESQMDNSKKATKFSWVHLNDPFSSYSKNIFPRPMRSHNHCIRFLRSLDVSSVLLNYISSTPYLFSIFATSLGRFQNRTWITCYSHILQQANIDKHESLH